MHVLLRLMQVHFKPLNKPYVIYMHDLSTLRHLTRDPPPTRKEAMVEIALMMSPNKDTMTYRWMWQTCLAGAADMRTSSTYLQGRGEGF